MAALARTSGDTVEAKCVTVSGRDDALIFFSGDNLAAVKIADEQTARSTVLVGYCQRVIDFGEICYIVRHMVVRISVFGRDVGVRYTETTEFGEVYLHV